MASVVDICNLALALNGDEATVSSISPPDGSAQASHCQRFYPIARDAVLEAHAWHFARRRAELQTVEVDLQPDQWAFAYALPVDCLKPLQVLTPGAADDAEGDDFLIESDADGGLVLFTNTEDAILRYTRKVTDTAKFPPLVVNAVARLLASYLAGSLVKGDGGIKLSGAQMSQFLKVDMPAAVGADASKGKRSDYRDFNPSSVAARA